MGLRVWVVRCLIGWRFVGLSFCEERQREEGAGNGRISVHIQGGMRQTCVAVVSEVAGSRLRSSQSGESVYSVRALVLLN